MLNSEIVGRLAIPGLPEWSGLVVLLVGLLVVVAFVIMPFSVLGLKSRLDAIEAQLDDIQGRSAPSRSASPNPACAAAPQGPTRL